MVTIITSSRAQAQASLSQSGSANSYQPMTDNPQNNVSKGLQNTTTSLQNTNNQNAINQQNLLRDGDLIVVGTKSGSKSSTPIQEPNNEVSISKSTKYLILAVGGAVLVAAFIFIRQQNKVASTKLLPEISEAEAKPTSEITLKPKKKKSKTNSKFKKPTAKKRKKKK